MTHWRQEPEDWSDEGDARVAAAVGVIAAAVFLGFCIWLWWK